MFVVNWEHKLERSCKAVVAGYCSPRRRAGMDMGGGFGHRVEFGHDLDGFLRAYEMEGAHGMGSWIDHISKDFTSPHGIPLPFAEALVHLTPLGLDDAVAWLSVNAADFTELGAEAIVVEVIERRFSENRRAYHIALATGLTLGFIDDNPLLIAFSGAKWLINAKSNMASLSPEMSSRIDRSIARTLSGFETASYWALGGDVAAHLLHIADILPYLEHAAEGVPVASEIVDVGEGMVDVVDGLATLGLVFAARKAVRSLFGAINGVRQREAARLADMVRPRVVLVDLLQNGAPPAALVGTLTEIKALPAPSGGV